ncbi:MAG: hypothetical protein HY594_04505 [Candidatus Omnitrophica bacterium]|nr:hypothetical protein [Candidatus Omnitrophota bacterium]
MSMRRYSGQAIVIGAVILAATCTTAVSEEAGETPAAAPAQSSSAAPNVPAAQPAAPAPAGETPAPAVVVPAAPALHPIPIKFSGELMQINKEGIQPLLTVKDRYGVTKEMAADPASIKVTRGTDPAALDDLKQGDQVTVDYTYDVASGKRFVQSIAVGTAQKTRSSPAQ